MAIKIPKEVIEQLASVPLLSQCTEDELRKIAMLGTAVPVRDGKVLTRQGAPAEEFFLIRAGKARCLIDDTEVAEFGPGDFFGEMALLDEGRRNATVVADGPMDVLVLERREFWGLLDAAPSIPKKLLVALARRQREDDAIRR